MSRNDVVRVLARSALERQPRTSATLLESAPTAELAEFVARQDDVVAADLVRRLRPDRGSVLIGALPEPAASRILAALEPGTAAALITRLDDDARSARLADLNPALAQEIAEMMSYPHNVAGAIMDPRVAAFRPDTPVADALEFVRTVRDRPIHNLFTVDDDGQLSGAVSVQELAVARPAERLDRIARPNPPAVQALAPFEELTALAEDRGVSSVPVIDINNRLIGVIRHPELLRATQRDATADIQTMVGVSKEERALSPASFAVRKRLPWLVVNLGTAFLAAAVVGIFQNTIARFTALAVLMPIVAGQSGNTGAQALAVTMRGLALREIRARQWWRVARKELMVGATNGVAVAAMTAFAVFLWSQSVPLAAVIGTAMICSMIVAALAGASVPIGLILLRQDPAAASSIVLTTVTDVVGLFSFLGFATLASGLL